MHVRAGLAGWLVGACLAASPLVAWCDEEVAEKVEKSGFWIESEVFDAGEVTAGKDIVGTFIFHNETDEDVQIIRAKPS